MLLSEKQKTPTDMDATSTVFSNWRRYCNTTHIFTAIYGDLTIVSVGRYSRCPVRRVIGAVPTRINGNQGMAWLQKPTSLQTYIFIKLHKDLGRYQLLGNVNV